MNCLHPFYRDGVVDFEGKPIPIPCGSCLPCRIAQQKIDVDRMFCSWHSHSYSAFVTFTYDDAHLRFHEGFRLPTLSKDDVHKYLDNIKHQVKTDFEYYLCGEYGDSFGRPHYHAVFFGLDYKLHEKVFKKWKLGSVKVLPVTSGVFRYVAKYVTLPNNKEFLDRQYYDVGLEPPFRKMSRGLGLKVYAEHIADLSSLGYFYYHSRKISLSSYYFNKLVLHSDRIINVRQNNKYAAMRKTSAIASRFGMSPDEFRIKSAINEYDNLTGTNLTKKSAFE